MAAHTCIMYVYPHLCVCVRACACVLCVCVRVYGRIHAHAYYLHSIYHHAFFN